MVNNCTIKSNGVGIYWSKSGEYNAAQNCMITQNNVGMRITGGNNVGSNLQIFENTKGLVLANDTNSGHGFFTACTFNHNSTSSFEIDDQAEGYSFSSCGLYYGTGNHIYNSKGIRYYNCDFQFSDIELKTSSNLLMVGCRKPAASVTITLTSGSDFTYVNNQDY